MKWFAHVVIAGATAAVIAPPLVPAAIAGGTAPDWMEGVAKATGHPVKHRTVTHIFTHWVIASVICYFIHPMALAFALGGLSHVILDALTISGVPASPWSKQRLHLLGGRFRTGEPSEYIFAVAYAAICYAIGTMAFTQEFAPFFYNWGELYDTGVIDGAEWKANRFKFI